MNTIERRVGQELPDIAIVWEEGAGAVAPLATGWTPSVKISALAAPNDLLLTISTGITLADSAPNFVVAQSPTVWAELVTAWGSPLPVDGAWFELVPHLVRTADSKDRPWPERPVYLRLRPAIT